MCTSYVITGSLHCCDCHVTLPMVSGVYVDVGGRSASVPENQPEYQVEDQDADMRPYCMG